MLIVKDDPNPDRVVWIDFNRAHAYGEHSMTEEQKARLAEEEEIVGEYKVFMVRLLKSSLDKPLNCLSSIHILTIRLRFTKRTFGTENIVQQFNSLPRPRTTPSGLPNDWYFTLKPSPIDPSGHGLHIVHPPSELYRGELLRDTKSLEPAALANIVVRLLLKTVIERYDRNLRGERIMDPT